MVASLTTQPFGSIRAPENWARVASLSQFVIQKLTKIWMGIYVDDFSCAEPVGTVQSALHTVRAARNLFGLKLEPSKVQPPATSVELLGASIDVGGRQVSAASTSKHKSDYVALLRGVLDLGALTPVAAADIRGKLGFAQSLLFGAFGRAKMQDITTRQYSSPSKLLSS